MSLETDVQNLTAATTNLLNAVNISKATLDRKVTDATTQATNSANSATNAANSATASAASAASALNIYGNTTAMNTAVTNASTSATNAATSATNAANSATQAAASASSAAALVLGNASNLPSIAPSLNLDFANSKQLDPRITFSRASTAAFYDGKTTVKAEENLLMYSQDFDNSYWYKDNSSVTANSVVAPDGTLTADTVTGNGVSGAHQVRLTIGSTSSVGYTVSIYAKAGTNSFLQIAWAGDGSIYANYDLSVGVVGTTGGATSASIQTVGNGWYRCVMTTTSTLAAYPYFALAASSSDTRLLANTLNTSIYLWGAQLEQRAFPTAYTPTTSSPITNYIPVLQTAASNAARIDHDPVTGECKGLLIEEQRTNLLSYSSDFDNAAWNKPATSIAANCAVAVDGSFSADKMIADTTNAQHYTVCSAVVSAGSTYTLSVYAKAGGSSWISLQPCLGNQVWFNLATGSVGTTTQTGVTGSIVSVGNGWYRCSATITSAVGNSHYIFVRPGDGQHTFTGDGYSGIYIWGAQLEAGAFATSYIPTALTYSGRASTATYQGDDGFLATAAVNTPRYQRNAQGGKQLLLEGAGTNLLLASERFDAVWSKSALATVVPNTDVAPNGTLTADSILFSGADQTVAVMTASPIVGQTVTGSVYVKGTPGETIQIAVGGPDQAFTLDGTWQRLVATKTAAYNTFNINNFGGVTARSIKVWGAQLETGSVATSYMPSVDTFTSRSSTATYFDSTGVLRTAPANAPRYGYGYDASRAKWVSAGLLVESQATNLLYYSEQFDNAAWTHNLYSNWTNAGVTANSSTAPDETLTADTLSFTSNTGNRMQRVTGLSANTTYTFSIFAKSANANNNYNNGIYIRVATGNSGVMVSSGFVNSIISSSLSTTLWKRFEVTFTIPSSGVNEISIGVTANQGSTPSADIYFWGAQLEAGSVATSYIPTASAQVTRAADVATSVGGTRAADVYSSAQATRVADAASMTGTNFSSWYRTDEGSFYAQFKTQYSGTTDMSRGVIGADGSATKRFIYIPNQQDYAACYDGVVSAPVAVDCTGTDVKVVSAYDSGNKLFAANASAVTSLASTGAYGASSSLAIGNYGPNANYLCGHIKKLSYYPKRLSNTELVALTS